MEYKDITVIYNYSCTLQIYTQKFGVSKTF